MLEVGRCCPGVGGCVATGVRRGVFFLKTLSSQSFLDALAGDVLFHSVKECSARDRSNLRSR